MKQILITAYAVNPYKGSEEGTGWNLICQAARFNQIIAVTRKNNRADIQRYVAANPDMEPITSRITWLHFDLPRWAIAWKKGPLLSALYFYIWQFCVALWLKQKKLSFDIAHSVNFHSNWTPSFLWILGKPFVWGPVGNHPLIPKQYILSVYGKKAFIKDRLLWAIKWAFWNLDPFLYICRKKAVKVFCVNTQAAEKLRLPLSKAIAMPAVATEAPNSTNVASNDPFTVLSVGRFVALKGFDITIRAFAQFYKMLDPMQRSSTKLVIIGTGPEKQNLQQLIRSENMEPCIELVEWMPREAVIQQFQQSSVYLFPSHEGAGMVVAEALSYGLPVVCLNNYGPGEYVHPQTQLAVKQGNYPTTVQQMALALLKLFSDTTFYQTESNLAFERYQQLFRWDIKGDTMEAVYNKLVNQTASATIQQHNIQPQT